MDAIKKLALAHGEKVGMAIIALLAGYIVYSSLGQETLPSDKQAGRLDTMADTTKSDITNYTWQKALATQTEAEAEGLSSGRVALLHEPLGSSAVKEVPAEDYAITGWDKQVVPATVLRTDPQLLAPTDLETGAVTGLFAFYSAATIRDRQLEAAREQAEAEAAAAAAAEDGGFGRQPGALGGRNPGRGTGRGAAAGRGRGGDGGRGMMGGRGGGMGFGTGLEGDENRRPVNAPIPPAGIPLAGDEKIVKMSCASVAAKVPIDEQFQAYLDVLENSKGFDGVSDYPRYAGYYVERAEVIRGEELQWKPVLIRNGKNPRSPLPGVSAKALADAVYDWAQLMEDPADPRYSHPILTFPLPPLVGRDWNELARHSEVPLASEYEDELMNPDLEDDDEDADEDDGDIFAAAPNDGSGRGGQFAGEMGGRGGMMAGRGGEMGGRGAMMGGRGGEMAGRGAMMGGRGGEMGGRGMMGGGGRGGMGMGGGRGGFAAGGMFGGGDQYRTEMPFVMFRFFDFGVQPGKRYKYRVRLAVYDVNFGVPKHYLDKAVIDRLKPVMESDKRNKRSVLFTPWSDASPTVAIPQSGRGMLAGMTPSVDRNPNSEPNATLVVSAFAIDEDNYAVQASVEKEFRLGSLLAEKGDIDVLVDQNRFIETKEDFEVNTGIILLDLEGGEALGRSELTEPGLALLMDAGGRLYVKNELDDEVEVAIHQAIFNEDEARGQGRDFGGRGDYGRGGGNGNFFGDF